MTQQLPASTPSQSHTTPKPSSTPPPPRRNRWLGTFTPRTVAAPIAAFTMAIILYAYSVTSIRAAKRNAALHRAADGGQLDMRRESLRRHGVLDQVEGTKGLQLFRESRTEAKGLPGGDVAEESAVHMGDKRAETRTPRMVVEGSEEGRVRTGVEVELEGWKGREGIERRKTSPPVRPGVAGSKES